MNLTQLAVKFVMGFFYQQSLKVIAKKVRFLADFKLLFNNGHFINNVFGAGIFVNQP